MKKRKMGEMGVLENEEDGGEEGYLREEGGRKRRIEGIGDGRERSMGRRGRWEKREGLRMRKMGVKRVI